MMANLADGEREDGDGRSGCVRSGSGCTREEGTQGGGSGGRLGEQASGGRAEPAGSCLFLHHLGQAPIVGHRTKHMELVGC
jgi:hypothetical protein